MPKKIIENIKNLTLKKKIYLFIIIFTMLTSLFIVKLLIFGNGAIPENNLETNKVEIITTNSGITNTGIIENITSTGNIEILTNSGNNVENTGTITYTYTNTGTQIYYKQNNELISNFKRSIFQKYLLKNRKNKDNIDFYTDEKITKFVNNNVSFNELDYEPNDLEIIKGQYIIDSKGGARLRKEANEKLLEMSNDFYKEIKQKIVIVSAYRDYEYQKGIKAGGCSDNLCAKPGYSEHQSGLAIDLWDASTYDIWNKSKKLTMYYNWLYNNAQKYGFTNTYQKGIDVDGYEIEPWHWRYIGVEIATYLKENNLTLAEFYHKNQ